MSIENIIVLVIVNLMSVVCIGLIGYFILRKTETPKTKLFISIMSALVSIVLWAMISINSGIYFWIKSGNVRSLLVALPLFLCSIPTIFPVVAMGTYIQLSYRDKIMEYTDSIKRKHPKDP